MTATIDLAVDTWAFASGIEKALINVEANAGVNVHFARRPLTSTERAAGTRFGDLNAIVSTNTRAGSPMINALYAAAAAATLMELFGTEEGIEEHTVEVAAAAALLAALLTKTPKRYTDAADEQGAGILDLIRDSYAGGVLTVMDEATHQGINTDNWRPPALPAVLGRLRDAVVAHPLRRTVERVLGELRTPRRVTAGTVTGADLLPLVQETSQKGSVDILNQSNQIALAEGRMDMAAAAPLDPTYLVASELLDKATCPPCRDIDGRRFETLDEARVFYPAGFVDCRGASRCRGLLIYRYET